MKGGDVHNGLLGRTARALLSAFITQGGLIACSASAETAAPAIAGPDASRDVETAPSSPVHCAHNEDCAPSVPPRVCDVPHGACVVPCTLAREPCSPDHYCDQATETCIPGCSSDDGCIASGRDVNAGDASGDGGPGAPKVRCDTRAHTCVACLRDVDCAEGTLCVGGLCVAACTSAELCSHGDLCCAGACVDPRSSAAHCGACDAPCAANHGAARCIDGVCTLLSCAASWSDCDGDIATGCEVDLAIDPLHCGACGVRCNAAHGVAACSGGHCQIASCRDPFRDCDGRFDTGCEANTATSMANCGSCGAACSPASANACNGGVCGASSCPGTLRHCDDDPAHACETDIGSDAANCGGCGHACALANATSRCAAGVCLIASCSDSFADCDGNPTNGCEVDLASDLAHCGACDRACTTGTCGSTLAAATLTFPTNWSFNGDAYYEITTGSVVLGGIGSFIYGRPIPVDSFVLTFDLRIGGGNGGDGMGFILETDGPFALGFGGGGLGMAGLSGFGVEFDTLWNNVPSHFCDGLDNHIAIDDLAANSSPNCNEHYLPTELIVNESLPFPLHDTGWHTVIITWSGKRVRVTLDGISIIGGYVIDNFVVGTNYYFGFSAAIGAGRDQHDIRNVLIAFPTPRCL